MDCLKNWKEQELVLGDLEGVLDEYFFFLTDLQISIILVFTKVLEVEKFLGPLIATFVEHILVLMNPRFLLEVNFACITLAWDLHAPETFLEYVEMHLGVNIWEHLSNSHYIGNDAIIEVLVE